MPKQVRVNHEGKEYIGNKGKWYYRGERKPEMEEILNKLHPEVIYSTRIKDFQGHKLIEILKYGESWNNPYDKEFQFGVKIARMLLDCWSVLEHFANTSGKAEKLDTKTSYLFEGKYTITKEDDFIGVYRRLVEEPYIKFEYGGVSIGVGIRKARALVQPHIKKQIEEFVHNFHS